MLEIKLFLHLTKGRIKTVIMLNWTVQNRTVLIFNLVNKWLMALSAKAVVYTDCISAEGKDSLIECLGYGAKQSDGEAPVLLELWGIRSTYSLLLFPRHFGLEW